MDMRPCRYRSGKNGHANLVDTGLEIYKVACPLFPDHLSYSSSIVQTCISASVEHIVGLAANQPCYFNIIRLFSLE